MFSKSEICSICIGKEEGTLTGAVTPTDPWDTHLARRPVADEIRKADARKLSICYIFLPVYAYANRGAVRCHLSPLAKCYGFLESSSTS